MDIFKIIDKTIVLYSTIAFAGFVYISKRIFTKKINKKFYNKEKKKMIRKFSILFTSINKNIEVRIKNKGEHSAGTIGKLKAFCEKIYQEKNKDEHDIKEIKSRKDEIFYYLLQNVSKMIIQNQQE